MNLLILPGNSPRHKQWAQEAKVALAPLFGEIRALHYLHWKSGEAVANIEGEIARARALVDDWDEYVILAKSIGTVIATLGYGKRSLKAERYIFLGVPYRGIADKTQGFDATIQTLPAVTIYQNSHDPFGSAHDVRARLETLHSSNITLVETPGNTHDYIDFAEYGASLRGTTGSNA